MSDRLARERRLAAITASAEKIPATLRVLHEQHGRHVHLRPTTSGVTLLGLTPQRPQRGKGGFGDMHRLIADFDRVFEEHCVAVAHGRETSEKAVQSALIRDAYEHDRLMKMFGLATADTGDVVTPIFVADELSLPHKGSEICCDLLALRTTPSEVYRPVVIELKWKRQMKRLIEQVTQFADLVEEHRNEFEGLASALLEKPVQLDSLCERWIVWPALEDVGAEPREDALAAHQIRVFTYWWEAPDLRLRGWAAPPPR